MLAKDPHLHRIRLDPTSRMPIDGPVQESRVRPLVSRPALAYVELAGRTNFSFLQQASSPEALVQRAAELGYDTIGITDRDGLYGIVRAHEEAGRQGIRVVIGCELTIEPQNAPTLL